MLVLLQFPIADLRAFLRDGAGRLQQPNWPPRPSPGFQPFVRGFGHARARRRGPDPAWPDEQAFCDAGRALRFDALPRLAPSGHHVRCAFRRLLFDGIAVARVELGLSYSPARPASPDCLSTTRHKLDGADILRSALCLPIFVPGRANRSDAQPLATAGPRLARHYRECTTERNRKSPPPLTGAGVTSGSPVAIIVSSRRERLAPLDVPMREVHAKPLKDPPYVCFAKLQTDWGALPTWFVEGRNASFHEVRSWRLCLARLHAEIEVLHTVLSSIDGGSLEYACQTPAGDRLEQYLNGATRWLNKSWWSGVEKSEITKVLGSTDSWPHWSELVRLRDKLAGARAHIVTKVERFVQMNGHCPNGRWGGPIIGNAHLHTSETADLLAAWMSHAGVDDKIKELIVELAQRINDVGDLRRDRHADDMASDCETIVVEASMKRPRSERLRDLVGSIEKVAQKIGSIGEPILTTCRQLVLLLQTLGA